MNYPSMRELSRYIMDNIAIDGYRISSNSKNGIIVNMNETKISILDSEHYWIRLEDYNNKPKRVYLLDILSQGVVI